MGKVIGPLHSIQVSGTVGSNIFLRNQNGNIVYSKPSWVDPNTSEQQIWRNIWSLLSSEWNNTGFITSVHRASWLNFSRIYFSYDRLGERIRLSPREWFFKLNAYRQRAGYGSRNNPEKAPLSSYYPEVYFIWDTNGIYVDCWPRPTLEQSIYISKIPFQNQARNFPPNKTAFAASLVAATSFPVQLWNAATVGTAPRRWFFKWVAVDNFGWSNSAVYDFIDTVGTPPKAFYSILADSWIDSSNQSTNYGASTNLFIQNTAAFIGNGLFAIDLTGSPVKVAKKFLVFYYNKNVALSSTFLNFYDLNVIWAELQTTWVDYQTGVPWTVPGMGVGSDLASMPFLYQNSSNNITPWQRWDISRLANGWLSGSVVNRGVAIKTVSDNSGADYWSKEAGSLNPYVIAIF